MLCLATGCATIENRPFMVPDGQTITRRFINGMPDAATNADARVVASEFSLVLGPKPGERLCGRWRFAVRFLQAPSGTVTVDDVTQGIHPVRLDSWNVMVTNGFWTASTPLDEHIKATEGWIDEPGETVKLFRFSVSTGAGPVSVLYQPAVYPVWFKRRLRDCLRLYGGGSSQVKAVVFE